MYRGWLICVLALPIFAHAMDLSNLRDCDFRLSQRHDVTFLDNERLMVWNDRNGHIHIVDVKAAIDKHDTGAATQTLNVTFRRPVDHWFLAGDKLLIDHRSYFDSSVLDVYDLRTGIWARHFLPRIKNILQAKGANEVLIGVFSESESEVTIKRFLPDTNTFLKDIPVPVDGAVSEIQLFDEGKSVLIDVVRGKTRKGVVVKIPAS